MSINLRCPSASSQPDHQGELRNDGWWHLGGRITLPLASQLTIYGCSNVSITLGERLVKRWQIKLLQHIPGKFQECYNNVAEKSCKKTFTQHHAIHSFRQSATIFTMLWQPF